MRRTVSIVALAGALASCSAPAPQEPTDAGSDATRLDAGSDAAQLDAVGSDTGSCDADGDHHDATACGGDDCDDTDAHRYPGNVEVCDVAGHDEDCDPLTYGVRDGDGDGAPDARCCNDTHCGDDCDDTRAGVHPSAPESCDAIDDDCDGAVDEMVLATFYRDADHDTYGVDSDTMQACSLPVGYAATGGDCDDTDSANNPGNAEACDARDNDCDITVDEMVATVLYRDADRDGFGDPATTMPGCMPTLDWVIAGTDCDDTNPDVVPGTLECVGDATSRRCTSGTWQPTTCNGATAVCDYRTDACAATACGDGHLHAGEECDDGNQTALDGCDDVCRTEPGATRALMPYFDTPFDTYLQVVPVAAAASYEVELAAGRTFAVVASTVTLAGPRGIPATGLPVGRWWWRARAVSASGARGAWTSPRPTRVERYLGDYSGDGRYDLAAGDTSPLRVAFVSADATQILDPTGRADGFAQSISSGDIDGDGFDDLLVSNSSSLALADRATYVYLGGATDFEVAADFTIPLSGAVQVVGDLEGDGYDDIAILSAPTGPIAIWRGGRPPSTSASFIISTASSVADGDVDGDGLADLIVGDTGVSGGEVRIYRGGFDTTADASLHGTAGFTLGTAVAAGDVDFDGYEDVIATGTASDGSGEVLVWLGGPFPLDATADFRATGCCELGASLAAGADLDSDGPVDVIVGQPGASSGAGAVVIYFGATSVSSLATETRTQPGGRFGQIVTALDGMSGEFLVGAMDHVYACAGRGATASCTPSLTDTGVGTSLAP